MKAKKVLVAISGGVDSAVSVALLKKQGFNVEGIFFRLADTANFKAGEKRTRRLARALKIPLRVLDLRKSFRKEVMNYFIQEYQAGRTPNPCVVCNKRIKFNRLLKLKADFVTTGHYARVKNGRLFRAKDKEKDQSYFLWMLNQNQLRHILFPVGDYTKKEVRVLAKKFKLPVFKAPESQEVCFIPKTTNDFLKRYIKQKPGPIIDCYGKILGKHKGLAFYTIGQRKGIGLSQGPFWVKAKDLKKNLLIVTKNEKDLLGRELICRNVNWISGKVPKFPLRVKAKIRYRSRLVSATIKPFNHKTIKVVFDNFQRAITPGQSIVFYLPAGASAKAGKGSEILGGAIIA